MDTGRLTTHESWGRNYEVQNFCMTDLEAVLQVAFQRQIPCFEQFNLIDPFHLSRIECLSVQHHLFVHHLKVQKIKIIEYFYFQIESTLWTPLSLARVVAQKSCFCHITPILADLHWLPVRHRINFKIATIAFKVWYFQQPSYLATLVPRYVPMRSLQSLSSLPICIPSRKTAMARSKSFHLLPRTLRISYHVIFPPFPFFLLSGRDSTIIFFRVPFRYLLSIHWHHALWSQHIHECKLHHMHLAAKLTRSSWVPTISLDSHQNIRLHTGARVNVVLLTYGMGKQVQFNTQTYCHDHTSAKRGPKMGKNSIRQPPPGLKRVAQMCILRVYIQSNNELQSVISELQSTNFNLQSVFKFHKCLTCFTPPWLDEGFIVGSHTRHHHCIVNHGLYCNILALVYQ